METVKDQLLSVIKAELEKINQKLDKAKIKFADSYLNDGDWSVRGSHERDCQIYIGQIEILQKIENHLFRLDKEFRSN